MSGTKLWHKGRSLCLCHEANNTPPRKGNAQMADAHREAMRPKRRKLLLLRNFLAQEVRPFRLQIYNVTWTLKRHCSNANTRFQSFFMLTTLQPWRFA